MQKKDISKQNSLPSAPINGKHSKTSKGCCFLKLQKTKQKLRMEGQLRKCMGQDKGNLSIIRDFLLKLLKV